MRDRERGEIEIYIYIQREREKERERKIVIQNTYFLIKFYYKFIINPTNKSILFTSSFAAIRVGALHLY